MRSRLSLLACLFLAPCLLSMAPAEAQEESDDDFFIFEAEQQQQEEDAPAIYDPIEPFNRTMFELNDVLYRDVVKPVSVAYRVVPRRVRISIANFFDNLGTPVSALNALLQLDIENSGSEIARFGINSTLGIVGLFDPATEFGLEEDTEDLGQTLGRYGLGHGIYLVIPLIGPTSLRDGLGRAGDAAVDPFMGELNRWELAAVKSVDGVTELSLDENTYESFYDNALDPYIFFRSSYVQNRRGVIER